MLNFSSILGGIVGREIPEWMGLILDRGLYKAAGHKYLRRVPTGNAKHPYRYFYTVGGGHGMGHESEFVQGAAFKMKHGGKDGHFHVTGKSADGKIKIKHDESGHETEVDASTLSGMLRAEHAEAIGAHKAKVQADIAQAEKTGSSKQRERLKAEAEKAGVHLAPASPPGGSKADYHKAQAGRHADLAAAADRAGDKAGQTAHLKAAKAHDEAARVHGLKPLPHDAPGAMDDARARASTTAEKYSQKAR